MRLIFLIRVYSVPGTEEPSPFTSAFPRDTHVKVSAFLIKYLGAIISADSNPLQNKAKYKI